MQTHTDSHGKQLQLLKNKLSNSNELNNITMSTSDTHNGDIKTGNGLTTPGGRCTGLVGIDMLPRRPSNRSLEKTTTESEDVILQRSIEDSRFNIVGRGL